MITALLFHPLNFLAALKTSEPNGYNKCNFSKFINFTKAESSKSKKKMCSVQKIESEIE